MSRLTCVDSPSIPDCLLCKNNHNCWECKVMEEMIERLWKYEGLYEDIKLVKEVFENL